MQTTEVCTDMLKRLVWELSATITGRNFRKEYNQAIKLHPQVFLRNLLIHAYNNVPFYHNLLEKVGLIKKGDVCLVNFGKTPMLTKEIITRCARELISRDYKKRKWSYSSSSGSTGEPLKFIQDRSCLKWMNVMNKYYYEDMLGINEAFAKKALLWAAQDVFGESFGLKTRMAKTIYNDLTNTLVLDCLRMTVNDMEHYVRAINSYKPKIVRGYASALYEICKFIEKRELSIYTPTAVVSSAEMLRADLRNKIETVFGTRVYDFYGSREVDGIAGECKCGLLHIFMFNNYIEVVDDDNNKVNEGENGRIIATNLHNYSMPFVRYDIGDMAVLGPEKCNCGNPLPTLTKISGRVCCFFRKEDGTLIDDGYFMGLFAQKEWMKAFRVVQEDYKKIRIMIVLREGTVNTSEKGAMEEQIRLVMGKDCKVKWEVVDEIPKTRMGKYLYTQSLISG